VNCQRRAAKEADDQRSKIMVSPKRKRQAGQSEQREPLKDKEYDAFVAIEHAQPRRRTDGSKERETARRSNRCDQGTG